jgi:hypothetical protein
VSDGPVTDPGPAPGDAAPSVALPDSLRAAVVAEFSLAFHRPFTTPIVVLVNALLTVAAWFYSPVGIRDLLFKYHGTLALPMVLASWMLSDVPATNVLGPDPVRVRAALEHPLLLQRLLLAKNVVLWTLVAPACAVLAVLIGWSDAHLVESLMTVAWILFVPVGALGVSAWVGILFPYHPRPLSWRWANRRSFGRVIVRWLTLAVTPYVLVTWIALAILYPSVLIWEATTHHDLSARISSHDFTIIVTTAIVLSVLVFLGGHRIGLRLARRRRHYLAAYLADPDRG